MYLLFMVHSSSCVLAAMAVGLLSFAWLSPTFLLRSTSRMKWQEKSDGITEPYCLGWLLWLSNIFLRSTILLCTLIVHFFIWIGSVPFDKYSQMCLYIYLLMNMWVVSKFQLPGINCYEYSCKILGTELTFLFPWTNSLEWKCRLMWKICLTS